MMRKIALAACLALSIVVSPALAQTTNGKGSGINAARLTALRKSGIRVFIPTYVPAGYSVKECEVQRSRTPLETFYRIRYVKGKSSSFTIQVASEGIGDIFLGDGEEPTSSLKFRNPVLGNSLIDFLDKGSRHEFVINWLELKGKQLPRFLGMLGSNVPAIEVKKIAESIRVHALKK